MTLLKKVPALVLGCGKSARGQASEYLFFQWKLLCDRSFWKSVFVYYPRCPETNRKATEKNKVDRLTKTHLVTLCLGAFVVDEEHG